MIGEDIWVDMSINLFGAHSMTSGMTIEIAIRNQMGVVDGTGMLDITTVLPPSAAGVLAEASLCGAMRPDHTGTLQALFPKGGVGGGLLHFCPGGCGACGLGVVTRPVYHVDL